MHLLMRIIARIEMFNEGNAPETKQQRINEGKNYLNTSILYEFVDGDVELYSLLFLNSCMYV